MPDMLTAIDAGALLSIIRVRNLLYWASLSDEKRMELFCFAGCVDGRKE